MAANGHKPRRARIWPALLLIAVLLAACIGAVRWGLGDLVQPAPPAETGENQPAEPPVEAGEPAEPAVSDEIDEPAEPDTPAEDNAADTPEEEAGTLEEDDGQWNLRLVNRWNPLPEDYEIQLAEVPGGQQVDARIYDALMELLNAATEAELGPIVVAGYRTQEKQQSIYDEKLQSYLDQGYSQEEAVAQTEQWVALPGTSEHQLGLAVDLVDASYQVLDEAQASTPAQQWLMAHCWEYGFILRYPAEKQDITGIIYEPWHYRYVGRDHAQAIRQSGQCLEEFLQAEHP